MLDQVIGGLNGKLAGKVATAADPVDRALWEAAAGSIQVLHENQEAMVGVGKQTLTEFLGQVAKKRSESELLAYLETGAHAEAVISAVEAGTASLEEVNAVVTRRNETLLAVARELGSVGAKLLLGLIL